MKKAKILLMAIGAIGIVGGAIAAKARSHFWSLRCSAIYNDQTVTSAIYTLDSFGITLWCDLGSGILTVQTKVSPD